MSNPDNVLVQFVPSSTSYTITNEEDGVSLSVLVLDCQSSDVAIILCHGFNSHKQHIFLPHMAEQLHQKLNATVIRFDYRGCGDSTGTFSFTSYEGLLSDLRCVVSWTRAHLNKNVRSLISHSR